MLALEYLLKLTNLPQILEMDCPGQTCNRLLRIAHYGCGSGNTCNFDGCCVSIGGGSTERITDNSGSGKCKTKKTEASEDVEYEFEEEGQSCDCNTDKQCDEDEECNQMNKCGSTDPTEASGDVKAGYRFEE